MIRRLLPLLALVLIACAKEEPEPEAVQLPYRGVDASLVPTIEGSGVRYRSFEGVEGDFLDIVSDNGINTIRLRLWYDPADSRSSWDEVKNFCDQIHAKGLKVWITVHYSDTWADPGHQETPADWSNLTLDELRDSVYEYTGRIVREMEPEIIQIGNEINNGFLHPTDHRWNSKAAFYDLIDAGIQAVRDAETDSKVMLHFAGYRELESFLAECDTLDYDMLGLSYYPAWHGKSLDSLRTAIGSISAYGKIGVIAEFAYPFTFDWADWTNNIIGSEDQILPAYAAEPSGQAKYV